MKEGTEMRAVSRLQPAIWQRASLVRSFVEILSAEGFGKSGWAQCCRLLSELMDTQIISIVLYREDVVTVACEFRHGRIHEDSVGTKIQEGTLVAGVLTSNQTVVRRSSDSDRAWIGVPIRFGSTVLGGIFVEDANSDSELVTLFESCALSAGSRIYGDAMVDNTAKYEQLAFNDALTGIPNRRRFDETLQREWSRAIRSGTPLTMMMLDVDFFKIYNDTYGHPAGDACLQAVAKALKSGVHRSSDLCARYGGEEFVVLLPDMDVISGARLAETLLTNIKDLALPHAGSSLRRVSISIGVSSVVPKSDSTSEALSLAADAALYEAKHAGRNRVFAVGYAPAVPAEPAVLRRKGPVNNLPRTVKRLIGRVHEQAEIKAMLVEDPCVSLVACGGAGKTRLSLAIAADLAPDFVDGTWFIDLAKLSDPTIIPATIGALFTLELSHDESATYDLARGLATKRSLIILDNCEHVIEAVATIAAEIVDTCPEIRIIATSREPLGIPGEAVYRVPLLSMPAPGPLRADEVAAYDALALFAERAKSVKRGFVVSDENASTIAAICLQLDGIPLAIELAAARVAVISISEIANRLDERFKILKGGDRTALPRQQTMRALIDWSYDLLSLEEQLLFRRLAVFAGGWTIGALTEICAGTELDEEDVFDLLSGLVRKSLVVDTIGDEESRYRFLESVREYSKEKLETSDESYTLHRRHAVYYMELSKHASTTHFTTASRKWLKSLQPETENFRGALNWTLTRENDITLGAELAGSLVVFQAQVSPTESLRWTRRAIALLPPDTQPAIEAALWYGVGRAAENLPADQMREAAERAVALSRVVGDPSSLGEALRQYILVLGWYYPEETDLAQALAQEAMNLARAVGEPIQIALALRSQSVTLAVEEVNRRIAILEESLALLLGHGNDLQTAIAFMWLAETDFCSAGGEKASTYAREAMRFAEESGSASMSAQMCANLAQYTAAEGDWTAARRAIAESAQLAMQLGMDDQITWVVQALAVVIAGDGDYMTAARLLGFCDQRAGTLHSQRQANGAEDILYQRLLGTLREHMSDGVLEAAMLSGTSLNQIDALATGSALAAVA